MSNNHKKNILIVDDKKENIDLLIAICKKFGHNYITAQSGEESIDIINAKDKNIDLILMDVKMGGIGGMDAMKQIKTKRNIPIIAVTGYASETDRKNFLKQGFDDYISKPIDIPLLMKKINELFSSEKADN